MIKDKNKALMNIKTHKLLTRLSRFLRDEYRFKKTCLSKIDVINYFAENNIINNKKFIANGTKNEKLIAIGKALYGDNVLDMPLKKRSRKKQQEFYRSREWKKMRLAVFAKYGRRCLCCGATPESGAVMHIDHIKPVKYYPELALDFNNLQVLCEDCNLGKGDWCETDFRKAG